MYPGIQMVSLRLERVTGMFVLHIRNRESEMLSLASLKVSLRVFSYKKSKYCDVPGDSGELRCPGILLSSEGRWMRLK